MNLQKVKGSLRVNDMEEGDWSKYPALSSDWNAPSRVGQTLGLSWPEKKATVNMTFRGEDLDGDPQWDVELCTEFGCTEFEIGGQELNYFEDVLTEQLGSIKEEG